MNCPNCQNPLPPDVAFCPVCGCQVVQESYEYDVEPQPKKSATKIIVAIIAVVLVLAIAGTAVFFILKNKDDNAERPSADRTTTSQSADDEETKAANGRVTTTDAPDTTADSQITASTTAATSASNANLYEPETHYSPVVYYVSSPDGLLLKSGPGMNYDTLMKIANGSAVEIRGGAASDKNWVYIYYADANVYGWINNTLISSSKTPATAAPVPPTNGTYSADIYSRPDVDYYQSSFYANVVNVGSDRLMLRSSPDTSTKNNITFKMPNGFSVLVLGQSKINPNWYFVYFVNNGIEYSGFASSKFIG